MAVTGIFKHLSSIEEAHQNSIVSVKAQSGKRISAVRGPFLYNFRTLPVTFTNDSSTNDDFLDQLHDTVFLSEAIYTSLPGNICRHRGVWSGSPKLSMAGETGKSISCNGSPTGGGNIGKYGRAGDYVQFEDDDKVYQLTSDCTAQSNGTFTLNINSPKVVETVSGKDITFGNDVVFKLVSGAPPRATYIPLNDTTELVTYSKIDWEEVI